MNFDNLPEQTPRVGGARKGMMQGWGFDDTLKTMSDARRAGRGHSLYYMAAWQRDLLRWSFIILVCYFTWFYYLEGGAMSQSAKEQYTKINEWIGDKETCISVEMPGYEGGDRQCFSDDAVGDVCGWDGVRLSEGYCEKTETGLLECTRKRGGGRCSPLNNKFSSIKKIDAPPKSLAKRKERKATAKEAAKNAPMTAPGVLAVAKKN